MYLPYSEKRSSLGSLHASHGQQVHTLNEQQYANVTTQLRTHTNTTKYATKKETCATLDLSVSLSVSWPVILISISHTFGHFLSWVLSVSQYHSTTVQVNSLSVSRSLGLSVSRSFGLSVSRSLGLTVSRSLGLSVSRSFGLSVSQFFILMALQSFGLSVSSYFSSRSVRFLLIFSVFSAYRFQ